MQLEEITQAEDATLEEINKPHVSRNKKQYSTILKELKEKTEHYCHLKIKGLTQASGITVESLVSNYEFNDKQHKIAMDYVQRTLDVEKKWRDYWDKQRPEVTGQEGTALASALLGGGCSGTALGFVGFFVGGPVGAAIGAGLGAVFGTYGMFKGTKKALKRTYTKTQKIIKEETLTQLMRAE